MDGISPPCQETNGFISSLIQCEFFDKITEGLVYIPPLMFPGNSLGNFTTQQKTDSWECICYMMFCSSPCRIEMPFRKLSPKDVYNLKVAGKLSFKSNIQYSLHTVLGTDYSLSSGKIIQTVLSAFRCRTKTLF